MAGGTSGADVPRARAPLPRAPQAFGTIAVVGGGCYGRYYVRQLRRAADAGAVTWRRLDVVDRDATCLVARTPDLLAPVRGLPAPQVVVQPWRAYFAATLADAAEDDAIVPSPLMPHLMVEWILDRVAARWPGRPAGLTGLGHPLGVPWERADGDNPHVASFATWQCPINCIEPARCPHTRGPRDWSMPEVARRHVAEAADGLQGPLVFHCAHRAYGVGMFDSRTVRDAGARVLAAAADGPCAFLVASVSHCHGVFTRLAIGPTGGTPGPGSG